METNANNSVDTKDTTVDSKVDQSKPDQSKVDNPSVEKPNTKGTPPAVNVADTQAFEKELGNKPAPKKPDQPQDEVSLLRRELAEQNKRVADLTRVVQGNEREKYLSRILSDLPDEAVKAVRDSVEGLGYEATKQYCERSKGTLAFINETIAAQRESFAMGSGYHQPQKTSAGGKRLFNESPEEIERIRNSVPGFRNKRPKPRV